MTGTETSGTSIRIFLADGTPDGLRIVEKSNWVGQAVMASRAQYPEVRSRVEFGRPGVYLLWGSSEGRGFDARIYVGEADTARSRIDAHVKTKDFWTKLILFTSKDESLNKAHVKYLESRLVDLAKRAKRAELDNTQGSQLPTLSEPEVADAESFLRDMLLIYPILGVSAFEVGAGPKSASAVLHLTGKQTSARGRDEPEGFVVLAGSKARAQAVPKFHPPRLELRARLKKEGVLGPAPEGLVLTQDYVFNSPSEAASIMLGRDVNGRMYW